MPQELWEKGQWESIVVNESKVTAIHTHLMPNSKILYFHARYPGHYGKFTSYIFDPSNNSMVQKIIPVATNDPDNNPSALFCSGHTFLSDGKLLVAGGERHIPPVSFRGIKQSFIYDINNPSGWSNAAMMNKGRWYPQLTRLPNGRVVAMSGFKYESQTIEETPEYFDPLDNLWHLFSNATYPVPLYNGAYVIPFGTYAGEIFYDLVSWGIFLTWNIARRFNASDSSLAFRWNEYGGTGIARPHGNSCMLPIKNSDTFARVINIGTKDQSTQQMNSSMIEIGNDLIQNPQWINLRNMTHDRHDAPNLLLLAEGTPIVFGGDHTNSPEKLNYSDPTPANWTWTVLEATASVDRKYHSTALLQRDGRVWTGGSRLYQDPPEGRNEYEDDMERRIEIYSPGYLFDGSRPKITNAPDTINYTNGFQVSYTTGNIDSVVLISLPSVTHCFDANQKYVILDFIETSPGTLSITPPANANIAQPGPYMLFLLRKKNESTSGTNRIPSEAVIVSLI